VKGKVMVGKCELTRLLNRKGAADFTGTTYLRFQNNLSHFLGKLTKKSFACEEFSLLGK
jgi:hypothetical protein